MYNPDVSRYERELKKHIQGFRRRRVVLDAFHNSLKPLLEDLADPTYENLEEAFGPPEELAEELMQSIPNLPSPMQLKQKVLIVVLICLVVVVACGTRFYWENMPETQASVSNVQEYREEELYSDYEFQFSEEFTQHDVSWTQERKYQGYLLIFENTNQVETKVMVKYSDHQPPHYLVIPAGEQRVLRVDDVRPIEHTISFSTPDGSMSGTVQVFMYLPS